MVAAVTATMATTVTAAAMTAEAAAAVTAPEAAAVPATAKAVATEAMATTKASTATKSTSHAQEAEPTPKAEAAAIVSRPVPAIRVEAARAAVELNFLNDGRWDVVETSDREGRRASRGEAKQRDSGDHRGFGVHPISFGGYLVRRCRGRR